MDEQVEGIVKLITSNDPAHWELVVEYAKQPYMKDAIIEAIPLAVAKIMTTPMCSNHRFSTKNDANGCLNYFQENSEYTHACHIDCEATNLCGFASFRRVNIAHPNMFQYQYQVTVPPNTDEVHYILLYIEHGNIVWELFYSRNGDCFPLAEGNKDELGRAYETLFYRLWGNMLIDLKFYNKVPLIFYNRFPTWVADQLFRNQMPI